MSTALATLAGKLAERVGMDSVDPQELITTLRQTAFKGAIRRDKSTGRTRSTGS